METLAERLVAEGPLRELDAVGWAIRLCKRIEIFHAVGIVHGRISTSCIRLKHELRTSKGAMLQAATCPVDVAFHSPERAAGGGPSESDDCWAIAATLFTIMTGTKPYSGATDTETRQKILSASPAPLAVFDVGDDELQAILDKAFARTKSRRFQSVRELRLEFEKWHTDSNVRDLPPLDDEIASEDELNDKTVMRRSPFVLNEETPNEIVDEPSDMNTVLRTISPELMQQIRGHSVSEPTSIPTPLRPPPSEVFVDEANQDVDMAQQDPLGSTVIMPRPDIARAVPHAQANWAPSGQSTEVINPLANEEDENDRTVLRMAPQLPWAQPSVENLEVQSQVPAIRTEPIPRTSVPSFPPPQANPPIAASLISSGSSLSQAPIPTALPEELVARPKSGTPWPAVIAVVITVALAVGAVLLLRGIL